MTGCASLVARPFHREGWVYEEKIDGMVAYKQGPTVRLVSRQNRDHTRRELVDAIATLPADKLVLDGEVAVFDAASSAASNGSGAPEGCGHPAAPDGVRLSVCGRGVICGRCRCRSAANHWRSSWPTSR